MNKEKIKIIILYSLIYIPTILLFSCAAIAHYQKNNIFNSGFFLIGAGFWLISYILDLINITNY